ncbi:hypothetical protein [Pseudomonas sp.]|uniref:hypothetical protein n=1 Tax=Pseudomonas sp. TaxID=306 RepID=UPI003F3095FA
MVNSSVATNSTGIVKDFKPYPPPSEMELNWPPSKIYAVVQPEGGGAEVLCSVEEYSPFGPDRLYIGDKVSYKTYGTQFGDEIKKIF